jgi:stalled ribosome rescue protein Dom34
MAHFHAVVWIDHKQARILHFSPDESDKAVVHPNHSVRDVAHGHKGTGQRTPDDKVFFEGVAKEIASAGSILIVGPGLEKTAFAKFLAEKHPQIRANVEGVEAADHPTDGELLDHARRFLKAADRMRPQD